MTPREPDAVATRVLGVIPARIGSTRLPRKPLRLLCGKPMIQWVWERARDAADRVVVATDSDEIRRVCEQAGAKVVMTAAGHPSGTDRVAEAAAACGAEWDVVVNIQGDEPLVEPAAVRTAVAMVEAGFAVGTCATPVRSEAEFRDPSVVKVAATERGRALYFSRAPIPHRREGFGPGHAWGRDVPLRHVGTYAYRRESLMQFVRFDPSPLEAEEGLEQLRALENGLEIGVGVISSAERGVDTEEDLHRVERRLRALADRPRR